MKHGVALVLGVLVGTSGALACEYGISYSASAVQAVHSSGRVTAARLRAAQSIQSDCQNDAFLALLDARMADDSKLSLLNSVAQRAQSEAFVCLAKNGMAMPSKYRIALSVNDRCGSNAFCAVAERRLLRNSYYEAATRCE